MIYDIINLIISYLHHCPMLKCSKVGIWTEITTFVGSRYLKTFDNEMCFLCKEGICPSSVKIQILSYLALNFMQIMSLKFHYSQICWTPSFGWILTSLLIEFDTLIFDLSLSNPLLDRDISYEAVGICLCQMSL